MVTFFQITLLILQIRMDSEAQQKNVYGVL